MIPRGSGDDSVHAYYNYLYQHAYGAVPVPHTSIRWSGPLFVAVWGAVLIGFFFLYAWNFKRVHRQHGGLYGVSSFAGSIMERIGIVASLTWGAAIVMSLWSIYYIVVQTVRGYIY